MNNISFKKSFLNNLFDLPRTIKNKFDHVLKILEENPQNSHYTVRIRGHRHLWRIKVNYKYRLFYSLNGNSIQLLAIKKRAEDTYDPIFLDNLSEDDIPCVFLSNKDEIEIPKPISAEFISLEQLENWQIPSEYWQLLLELNRKTHQQFEEAILDVDIPNIFKERIIDNLYPRSLEQIEHKPDFILKEPEDLNKFLAGELTEFFLKLSKKQQELLDIESNVPTLIQGGAGTGKSILALYRVEKLIQSGVTKILFTTHTNTLVEYSQQLLHSLLGKPPQQFGVEVDLVDNLAQKYYRQVNDEPTIASEKCLLFCLESAIDSLELKDSHLKAIAKLGLPYLFEEILIVIEARGIETLDHYRQVSRNGRKYPLQREIREVIWSIYQKWQEILSGAGLTTIEQIRRKALAIADQLKDKPYDAVIIDEAQDLSPVALKFLTKLVSSQKGIYLAADTQQSLYQRSFAWEHIQASIGFRGQTHVLRRSFRNTALIGKACSVILSSSEVDQFSDLEGEKPTIILTDDLLQQTRLIQQFFERASRKFCLPLYSSSVILTPDPDYGKLIAQQLSVMGIPAEYVESQHLDLSKRCIKILSLHSAKGLEFPLVIVVGLKEGLLPRSTKKIPQEEREEIIKQERRLFYVGCSRAMRSLLVLGSRANPSQFIQPLVSNPYSYWQMEGVS
jgi:superfamily I DNA/RNA helicase/mRNA-degrading endonuclease RelE of RelBE toxin-antitoxin system